MNDRFAIFANLMAINLIGLFLMIASGHIHSPMLIAACGFGLCWCAVNIQQIVLGRKDGG